MELRDPGDSSLLLLPPPLPLSFFFDAGSGGELEADLGGVEVEGETGGKGVLLLDTNPLRSLVLPRCEEGVISLSGG